jgi:protein-S-isoprenylcysteine O-methyltransferase Ste14
MSEVLLLALSFGLNIALPYFVVRYDLKRLSDERLARAWPDASVLSAVYAFGPLCLPVHFARTRRSWLGLGLGLGVCALTVLAQALIVEGLSRVFGAD